MGYALAPQGRSASSREQGWAQKKQGRVLGQKVESRQRGDGAEYLHGPVDELRLSFTLFPLTTPPTLGGYASDVVCERV